MDPKDLEIEARLQKLRSEEMKPNTSNEQLVARLAELKRSSNQPGLTDKDLAERLSNVKGTKQAPSDDELERRLAKLKGKPIADPVSGPTFSMNNILVSKRKTDVEQVNDLLKQLAVETDIDLCVGANMSPNTRNSKTTAPSTSSFKQETMALVDKLVAESKLAPYPESNSSDEETTSEVDDWCTICNEDASLRCKGCSNDLYCVNCYKEFHTPSDIEDDHQFEKYNKKAKKKTIETAL